jgi:hypothetical protein
MSKRRPGTRRASKSGAAPTVTVRLDPVRVGQIDTIAAKNALGRSDVLRLLIERGLNAAKGDAVARSQR